MTKERFHIFQIIKTAFEPLKLMDRNSQRSASPMELFFDLIFVAGIASVSHFLLHVTLLNILLAVILFSAMYIVWLSFSFFLMRFWGASYFLRLFLFLIMFPLVLFASVTDTGKGSMAVLGIAFVLSRLILGASWFFAFIQNKDHFTQMERSEIIMNSFLFIGSGVIAIILGMILSPVKTNYIITVGFLVLLELFSWIIYYSHRQVTEATFRVDIELLKERHMLFLILIFGEGLIGVVISINWSLTNLMSMLVLTFLAFGAIYFFFLRVFEEGAIIRYNRNNLVGRIFSHMFTCLNLLMLYANIRVVLESNHTVHKGNLILLVFSLGIIICRHLWSDVRVLLSKKSSHDRFLFVDIASLSLMLFLTIGMLFVKDGVLLLLFIFLFFFIHSLPTIYRYDFFKMKLFS